MIIRLSFILVEYKFSIFWETKGEREKLHNKQSLMLEMKTRAIRCRGKTSEGNKFLEAGYKRVEITARYIVMDKQNRYAAVAKECASKN